MKFCSMSHISVNASHKEINMRDTSARKAKTKDAISEALVSLIKDNDYSEITVQEIAAVCNISRRTIYRHFKTKDEILSYGFRSCVAKLFDHITLRDTSDLHSLCLSYFKFWEENMDRLLMMSEAGVLFSFGPEFDSLVTLMADRMLASPAYLALTPSEISFFRYRFAYEAAGFWQITLIWSREDHRRSAEEMASVMVKILKFSDG